MRECDWADAVHDGARRKAWGTLGSGGTRTRATYGNAPKQVLVRLQLYSSNEDRSAKGVTSQSAGGAWDFSRRLLTGVVAKPSHPVVEPSLPVY